MIVVDAAMRLAGGGDIRLARLGFEMVDMDCEILESEALRRGRRSDEVLFKGENAMRSAVRPREGVASLG